MTRRPVSTLLATAAVASAMAVGAVQHATNRSVDAVALPADVAWTPLGTPIVGLNTSDELGTSIASSDDGHVMVVGIPGDDTAGLNAGVVRVVEWNGATWVPRGADFTGAAGQQAGRSVATSGDGTTMAFSAPAAGAGSGRVEVHRWSNGTWTPLGAPFTGTPGAPIGLGDLTFDGDTLVLGNPLDDTTGTDTGSVQVFDWNGTAWTQRGTTLRGATGGVAGDALGHSTAITPDGLTLVTSALYGDRAVADAGDVLVFDWDGTDWTQRGTAVSGTALLQAFGQSVDVDHGGTTIVVGAPFDTSGGADAGRTRVFDWDGTQWALRGTPVDGSTDDFMGMSVALDAAGDTLAVSSPYVDGAAGADSGHVQVFDWTGAVWQQRAWALEGDAAGDESTSVALSADGTTLAVGRPGGNGSVLVFASSVVRPLGGSLVGPVDFAEAGRSTALDADGDTMAVGMPGVLAGPLPGRVTVFRWLDGTWTPLGVTLEGTSAGDLFGADVAVDAAGDTLVVGAPKDDSAATDAGAVRIYDWNGTSWQQRGVRLDGVAANSDFGAAVDVDADGGTVVVGAPATDLTGTDVGQTTVWSWSGTAWQPQGFPIPGERDFDYSGAAVAISGDGSTVAVGDPYYEYVAQIVIGPAAVQPQIALVFNDTGRARAFRSSGANWTQLGSDFDGNDYDYVGTAVDLDHTGAVLAIGMPGVDLTGANAGGVAMVVWDAGTWSVVGIFNGEAAGDQAGTAVALNGDGTVVAIGAPLNDGGAVNGGNVGVLEFQGGDWHQLGDDLDGPTVGEESGSSVALSHDGTVVAVGSPRRLGPRPGDGAVSAYRTTRLSTPGRPTAAAVATSGTDRLTLTWTRQASDLLNPTTGSDIEISSDGGTTWTNATRAAIDPSGTTLTDLTPATTYRARVRDVNAQGPGPWHVTPDVATTAAALPALVDEPTTTVLAGDDPYELAAAISQHQFVGRVDTVYLITGETFPDAMVGGVAAARAQGPVLLTSRASLPEVTRDELERLQPERIVIVGGTNAVDEQVAAELRALATTVTRLGGIDRYDTAAAVATALAPTGAEVVYVASGTSHADAMVAAPMAAAQGAPLVLSGRSSMPAVTRDALRTLAPRRVVVVGGPETIADMVLDEMSGLAGTVERLYGSDLSRTALSIARRDWANPFGLVVVVDRRRSGDGLALTPLAALGRFPVLVTEGSCTAQAVSDELRRRNAGLIVATTDDPGSARRSVDTECPR